MCYMIDVLSQKNIMCYMIDANMYLKYVMVMVMVMVKEINSSHTKEKRNFITVFHLKLK